MNVVFRRNCKYIDKDICST